MSSMMMFEERHNVIGSKLSLMRLNSKWLMPNTIYPNWHKSLELIFVESGRLSLRIEREEYLLEKGEIAVINMGKVHYGNPPAGEQCILWVFLIELDEQMIWNHELEGKYLWPLIRKEIEIIPVLRQETEGCRRVKKCLEQMYTMLETKEEEPVFKRRIRTDNPICELKAISSLYELMYQIFDTEGLLITVSEGGKNTSVQRKNDICTILQYIEEHYTQKIYVEQLADVLYMGVDNFYKFFCAEMGTSPIQFVNNYRLKKAARLLRQTSFSMSIISETVGFQSTSYFTKLFKQAYGQTPSQYRKKYSK